MNHYIIKRDDFLESVPLEKKIPVVLDIAFIKMYAIHFTNVQAIFYSDLWVSSPTFYILTYV